MKKLLSLILAVAMVLSIVPFASAEGLFTPGTYEATAQGFGGPVTVSLTVDADKVTAAAVTGADETPTLGGAACEKFATTLVGISSAEDIDAYAGASVTSAAVKSAVADALSQASGYTFNPPESLTDGVYTGSGTGFSLTKEIPVTVTVEGGKIVSVEVGENGETQGMIAVAIEKYIPRIIEHQSLQVDALTGATASCVGINSGIVDALKDIPSSYYESVPPCNGYEEYDTDILVVGMGSSGTTAALAAAEKGVSVMAIDKAAKWGGTGVVTSGPCSVNAPSQVAAEIEGWKDPINGERTKAAGENLVDADALYNTWCEYTTVDGVQGAKTDLIAKVVYESGETCDWLEGYGFEFEPAVGFVGGKWAIFSKYAGNKSLTESFFAKAYEKYTEMGGKYLLETEAQELLVENGAVTGVIAYKADGTKVVINAKSVILCTGGFAGSSDLQYKYLGDCYELYGMETNDGKMIESAIQNGAATYAIGMYPMSHFVAPGIILRQFSAADNDIPYGLICTAEGMAVNRKGERFIDESNIAMNAFYQGGMYYYIYSSDQIDVLREKGLSAAASGRYLSQGGIAADTPLTNIDAVIEAGFESDITYKASTLEELAAEIGNGMTAENLRASIAGYNPEADAFGKDASKFERLGTVKEDAEYYVAFTGCPYIYSTCGGLDVNANFEVLDTEGNVIPGLFACGTDSMGVLFNENKAYTNYGGCAQGYCFVSGRDAAAYAAEQILAK